MLNKDVELRDRIIFNQDKIIAQQANIIETLQRQNELMKEVIDLQGILIEKLQNA